MLDKCVSIIKVVLQYVIDYISCTVNGICCIDVAICTNFELSNFIEHTIVVLKWMNY